MLNFFSGKGSTFIYRKKNIIEYGEKPAGYVYLIKKGIVNQYFVNQNGDIKTFLILTKGDLFGEIDLLQEDKNYVITQAYGDVEIDKISYNLFVNLLEKKPEIYYYINLMLSNKARIFMAQVVDSSFCDTDHKLRNLLTRLSYQYGEDVQDGIKIICRFTHEDLARMISSTRSTVTRKMKILENQGIIKIVNHYIIIKVQ